MFLAIKEEVIMISEFQNLNWWNLQWSAVPHLVGSPAEPLVFFFLLPDGRDKAYLAP